MSTQQTTPTTNKGKLILDFITTNTHGHYIRVQWYFKHKQNYVVRGDSRKTSTFRTDQEITKERHRYHPTIEEMQILSEKKEIILLNKYAR